MNKKFFLKLIFPHTAVILTLFPISTVMLVYSLIYLGSSSPVSIATYAIAFYTLTVICLRVPRLIRFVKRFKNDNAYAKRYFEDPRVRVNISLYGSLIMNVAYALLHIGMGFFHSSFWFFSLAAYYICLAVMRFFLLRYVRKNRAVNFARELKKYRSCGIVLLVLNLFLSLMIFFMVYWNRTFHHHSITAIAMAAYTFTAFTVAIVNLVRYRKFKSPILSAAKTVSLASACVSMLTLESTMLTAFGDGTMDLTSRRILLGATGGVIAVFILTYSIIMIVRSSKQIKRIKTNE